MFGWMKKRKVKEILKILYQNTSAVDQLTTYYEARGDTDIVKKLMPFKAEVAALANSFEATNSLEQDAIERLLQVNMELRRAYDMSDLPIFDRKTFDEQFIPFAGWDDYFASFS